MSATSHFWASVDDMKARLSEQRDTKGLIYKLALIAYSIGAKKDYKSIKDVPLNDVDKLAWELEVLAAELKG